MTIVSCYEELSCCDKADYGQIAGFKQVGVFSFLISGQGLS